MEQWKYDKEEDAERLYIDDIPQFKYRRLVYDLEIVNTDQMSVESLMIQLKPYTDKIYNIVIFDLDFLRVWHFEYYTTKEQKLTNEEIDTIITTLSRIRYYEKYSGIISKLEALRNET